MQHWILLPSNVQGRFQIHRCRRHCKRHRSRRLLGTYVRRDYANYVVSDAHEYLRGTQGKLFDVTSAFSVFPVGDDSEDARTWSGVHALALSEDQAHLYSGDGRVDGSALRGEDRHEIRQWSGYTTLCGRMVGSNESRLLIRSCTVSSVTCLSATKQDFAKSWSSDVALEPVNGLGQ